jgi:SAM-dependent methyltransferase
MPIPHASWAHYYDFVYENSLGISSQRLTELTLSHIEELAAPPCSIVDFGAGTGRMAIPLAQKGYAVTAVEPCPEIVEVLQSKAETAGVTIPSRIQRMQDFESEDAKFDVALCVFTTALYLLDEAALTEALTRLSRSLRKNGKLLIDIPSRHAFQGYRSQTTGVLDRRVEVLPAGSDIYTYHENTQCWINGDWQAYEDTFSIRYWPTTTIWSVLKANGIECEGPIDGFQGTGSDYYSGKKVG